MLDIECFTFLNRALESTLAPIVIFATNRGRCTIKGTDILAPHGIPIDLLDRLLIIRTATYVIEEIKSIIAVRAEVEDIKLDADALEGLAQIGESSSLRYAVQLLTPCRILAETNGRDTVSKEDIIEINDLFFDSKQSAKLLQEQAAKYLK